MRKTDKHPHPNMKMELDSATVYVIFKYRAPKSGNNGHPPPNKRARLRPGGFRNATLSLIKLAAEQAKRFGRLLQRMQMWLLEQFFFLARLLIVVGLCLCSLFFLVSSILEMLNGLTLVSWVPLIFFYKFSKLALANLPPKNKNHQRE